MGFHARPLCGKDKRTTVFSFSRATSSWPAGQREARAGDEIAEAVFGVMASSEKPGPSSRLQELMRFGILCAGDLNCRSLRCAGDTCLTEFSTRDWSASGGTLTSSRDAGTDFIADAGAEAGLLDLEIVADDFEFLAERDEAGVIGVERKAEQARRACRRYLRRAGVGGNEGGDGVERVEEEVGMDAGFERRETSFGEKFVGAFLLDLAGAQFERRPGACSAGLVRSTC
jgi:hypothetical protein